MQIYRSFDEIERYDNTVLTVGTFDGVHRGHQSILDKLLGIAKESHLRPVLLTIYPHPQLVLRKSGREPIRILTNINERIRIFRKFGVEHLLVVPFTRDFATTSPEEFVREYLHKKVGMKKILIGYDHMFGRNREGDESLLRRLGSELGFEIEKLDPLGENDIIISSTKIRKAITSNEIEKANEMLGFEYFLCGNVVRGDGRGRSLGIPTANIKSPNPHKLMPGNGVYCVSSVIDKHRYFGMANIGTRPTFTEDSIPTLEVNYFKFNKDIYDREICVEFHGFIRKETKFAGAGEFLKQLTQDKEKCTELSEKFYN